MKKLYTSQVVGLAALVIAILAPFAISYLQSAKVPINAVDAARLVSLTTLVAAACRSLVSKFSGTSTGLNFGTDTKALAANAGNIVNLAVQLLSKKAVPVKASDITAAVKQIVVRSADLDAVDALNKIDSAGAAESNPKEITAAFQVTAEGLKPLMPETSGAGAATQMQAYSGLPDQPVHSGEPFPVLADAAAEQPTTPVPGSIRELVPDWANIGVGTTNGK